MLKSFLGYMSQNRWARWSFLLFPLLILPPACSFLIAARYEICAPESMLFLCDEQWIGNYDNIFFSLGQGDGGGFFSFSNLEEVQIISFIIVGLAILVGLISFGIGCWLLRKLMLRKKGDSKDYIYDYIL
jgi:hypothetical protein